MLYKAFISVVYTYFGPHSHNSSATHARVTGRKSGERGIMKNLYITNAFSLNMLSGRTMVEFMPFESIDAVKKFIRAATEGEYALTVISAIGHENMARIVSEDLCIDVKVNRISVLMDVSHNEIGDCAIVAQYIGPRLPEGATSLPDGATIRYWLCTPGMEYCTEPI